VTFDTLFAPIAAATILNVFLFAMAWRGHQIEGRDGKEPWQLVVGALAYLLALGGFLYLKIGQPLETPLDVFGTALAGEAMGAAIVFGLINAFIRLRGRPNRERIPAMIASVFLLWICVSTLF
jgi:hypothetical protein